MAMNPRENYGEDTSMLGLLSREQERRFRAMAWRHIRRISKSKARKLWRNVRARDVMKVAA
jgi:hypothetical protein